MLLYVVLEMTTPPEGSNPRCPKGILGLALTHHGTPRAGGKEGEGSDHLDTIKKNPKT